MTFGKIWKNKSNIIKRYLTQCHIKKEFFNSIKIYCISLFFKHQKWTDTALILNELKGVRVSPHSAPTLWSWYCSPLLFSSLYSLNLVFLKTQRLFSLPRFFLAYIIEFPPGLIITSTLCFYPRLLPELWTYIPTPNSLPKCLTATRVTSPNRTLSFQWNLFHTWYLLGK